MSLIGKGPGAIGKITWSTTRNGFGARAQIVTGSGEVVRRYASGATRDEAESALKQIARSLSFATDEWNPLTPLSECFEGYLKRRSRRISDTTLGQYKATYQATIAKDLAAIPVAEITSPMIDGYLAIREQKGDSASYRKKVLSLLRWSLDFAVTKGCVGSNAARPIETPWEEGKEPEVPTEEQLAVAYKVLREWTNERPTRHSAALRFFEMAMATGLRISEVLALRPMDIDFEAVPALVTVKGSVGRPKGGGGVLRRVDKLKSKDQERRLRLPAFARPLFQAAIDDMISQSPFATIVQNAYGGLADPEGIRQALGRAFGSRPDELAAVGIKGISPHQLRKVVLTGIERESGDITLAASQAGHSTPDITSAHYVPRGELPIVEGAAAHIEARFASMFKESA